MIRRHSSYKIFFSSKAVLQHHGLSRTNKGPVTLSKNRNYILCGENLFDWSMFLLGVHQVINWRAAINQVRERVISLWMQITKQPWSPWPKIFSRFLYHLQIFPFLFLIVLTVLILKPRLHVGHFYLHTSFECFRDYQSVARVARVRFCNKIAETMLQNIHSIYNMLQILGTPGYTYKRHRLLSKNSLEDVKVASASRKS